MSSYHHSCFHLYDQHHGDSIHLVPAGFKLSHPEIQNHNVARRLWIEQPIAVDQVLDCSIEVTGYNVCLFTIPSIPYSTIHLLSLGKIQALLVLFVIYFMSIKFSKHSFFIHFYYPLTKNSLNRLLYVSLCPSCLVLLMSYSPSHLSSLFQISDFKFKCPF